MDISRSPDTGLIRGQIISAVTEVVRTSIGTRNGKQSGWETRSSSSSSSSGGSSGGCGGGDGGAGFKTSALLTGIQWAFIRKNCSAMFNYEWKPTVGRVLASAGCLARWSSRPINFAADLTKRVRTHLDRRVHVCVCGCATVRLSASVTVCTITCCCRQRCDFNADSITVHDIWESGCLARIR